MWKARKRELCDRIYEIEKKLDIYEQRAMNQSYGSFSQVDGSGHQAIVDNNSPVSKASKQDTLKNDNSEGAPSPNDYVGFGPSIRVK